MNYLEIVGTLVGLLYLWFEYKASIWLWPVSVIMPAIYIVVYYQVGLYADSGISVYYLLAGIYGWWVWLRHVPGRQEKLITFTPRKLFYAFVCCSMPCVCFDRWDIGNVYRQYNTMVG